MHATPLHRRRTGLRAPVIAGMLASLLWLLAVAAPAATITQTFMTNSAPSWVLGGSASLTSGGADPAGNGWLRLTPATTNQAGYAYYNGTPFTTSDGFLVEFEYGSWGGTSADGMVVYLFDGTTPTFQIGDFGGSLGYANGCSPTPGLSRAYAGIAFDEYGNFTNPGDRCKNGGPGQRANSVTVRGEGNGVDNGTNYNYLTHNQLSTATNRIDCPSSSCGTTRPSPATYYRQVRILIYPSGGTYQLMVEMRFAVGNQYETVINTYTLPTPPYPTLKIGFAASTGGSTNYHEIRNLSIDVFNALADKEIAGGFTAPLFAGGTASYDINVRNNGPDAETGPVTVTSAIPAGLSYTGYSGSGWSCSYSAPNATCTRAGTLASGASAATLTLNMNVTASAGSTLVMSASVSGAVFDHIFTNNTVTSTRYVYGGATSGVKSLYMYFNSAAAPNTNTLRRIVPTADSTSGTIAISGGATPWMTLTPALARPFTISAGTVQVPVCLTRTGSASGNRNARVELDYTGAATGTIGALTINNVFNPNNNTPRSVTFSIPVASAINLPAGTQVRARVLNQSTNTNYTFTARSYTAGCDTNRSRVDIASSTVVNVDSIDIYNAAFSGGSTVTTTFDNGATLYARAVVSDPFGTFDITGVDYALFDKNNVQVGTTQAMTVPVGGDNFPTTGQKTYQYAFTTPGYAGSVYSIRATAREGTEGTVSHQKATGLTVRPLPPLLSATKIASAPHVAPGGNISYSVTVTNSGTGAGTGVNITDTLSGFSMLRVDTYGALVPFLLTDISPPSGLALGTPLYSNDNGATYTYTPTSGGGGAPSGYDANVTHFLVPFSGSLSPSRSVRLDYQVQVR